MASSDYDASTLFASLVGAIRSLQATRYTSAAAATIYVYNIVLTQDEEMEHLWSRFTFTLPNLLYICNRYLCLGFFLLSTYDFAGFHGDFSEMRCRGYYETAGYVLAHVSWTLILTLRVVALWKSERYIIQVVWVLCACNIGAITVIASVTSWQIAPTMIYNSYIKMCVSTSMTTPKLLAWGPIAPTLYELFLTTLTVIKSYNFEKSTKSNAPPLLRVLARDGVSYFMISAIIAFGNMMSWLLSPTTLLFIFVYPYWALHSTIVSRLVLNLRKTYYDNTGLPTDVEEETEIVSANITFVPRSRGVGITQGVRIYPTSTVPKDHLARRERQSNVRSKHSFMGYEEFGFQTTVDPIQSEEADELEPVRHAKPKQEPETRERYLVPDSFHGSTDWGGVELQEMHLKVTRKEAGT